MGLKTSAIVIDLLSDFATGKVVSAPASVESTRAYVIAQPKKIPTVD